MFDAQTCACIIIIIIILRLRSSRPQVSSIDGGLEPSPTADCHLADYQDTQKTNPATCNLQPATCKLHPPALNNHATYREAL